MQQRSGLNQVPLEPSTQSKYTILLCSAVHLVICTDLLLCLHVLFLIVTKASSYAKMLPLETARRTLALIETCGFESFWKRHFNFSDKTNWLFYKIKNKLSVYI
ncbi:hypothetical protein ATANTOWER_009552 [Ataeniobius toweri]|uniref:Uncharacterized protein n=1 Tax=Ataeniobius toweri TaxID=208326 RepID=A0ABU7A5R2_9TELE|nr:hypothetical protein [Ataeniobius toweri]